MLPWNSFQPGFCTPNLNPPKIHPCVWNCLINLIFKREYVSVHMEFIFNLIVPQSSTNSLHSNPQRDGTQSYQAGTSRSCRCLYHQVTILIPDPESPLCLLLPCWLQLGEPEARRKPPEAMPSSSLPFQDPEFCVFKCILQVRNSAGV